VPAPSTTTGRAARTRSRRDSAAQPRPRVCTNVASAWAAAAPAPRVRARGWQRSVGRNDSSRRAARRSICSTRLIDEPSLMVVHATIVCSVTLSDPACATRLAVCCRPARSKHAVRDAHSVVSRHSHYCHAAHLWDHGGDNRRDGVRICVRLRVLSRTGVTRVLPVACMRRASARRDNVTQGRRRRDGHRCCACLLAQHLLASARRCCLGSGFRRLGALWQRAVRGCELSLLLTAAEGQQAMART
jgi:hypothetical protein